MTRTLSTPLPAPAIDPARTVLDIQGLRVGFPRPDGTVVTILDGVDLTVHKGEIVGLVGESGSGKSMLAMAAIGLIPPPGTVLAGHIRIAGQDLPKLTERELRHVRGRSVGMVFQDPMTGLNPVRTIGSILTESVRRHQGVDRAAAMAVAEAALKSVGIPAARERLTTYPHQLSGGLRQRVMIALALINQPEVIIADEPTTALDATIQAQILDLLRDTLHRAGGVLITHDLGVAAEICDRLAVIYHGRIVETGPTADILARPHHPYTQGLLDAVPRFDRRGQRLVPIPGMPPSPLADRTPCSFRTRCPAQSAACDRAPPLAPWGGDGERLVACHHPFNAQGAAA